MSFIINLLVSSLIVFGLSNILGGVHTDGFGTSVLVAIVLGLLNAFVKPLLNFISLPINYLTLGLFSVVINAVIILIASSLIKSFHVDSFWTALLFGILLGIVNSVIGSVIKE